MIVLCIAGGENSSAESALPWVLIEEGTSKQLSSEERFVRQCTCVCIPAAVWHTTLLMYNIIFNISLFFFG